MDTPIDFHLSFTTVFVARCSLRFFFHCVIASTFENAFSRYNVIFSAADLKLETIFAHISFSHPRLSCGKYGFVCVSLLNCINWYQTCTNQSRREKKERERERERIDRHTYQPKPIILSILVRYSICWCNIKRRLSFSILCVCKCILRFPRAFWLSLRMSIFIFQPTREKNGNNLYRKCYGLKVPVMCLLLP